jgi:hypothetical protein
MLVTYLILNLLLLLAIFFDFVYNAGKAFIVYNIEDLGTCLVFAMIPGVNVYALYQIVRKHMSP